MNASLSAEQKVIHFLNRTSFGPTRAQSSRARCSVGAMLNASVARVRSRETTTSLPSRVAFLSVASFIAAL